MSKRSGKAWIMCHCGRKQGYAYTNCGCQVAMVTEFCMEATNICGFAV